MVFTRLASAMVRIHASALLACLLWSWPTIAAEPQAATPLHDDLFGLETRALGLERRVEMFQWRETRATDAALGYETVWLAARIDSRQFSQPQGHANPAQMPFAGARWVAERVTLDGHPLDPALLTGLDDWQPVPPDPEVLPPNLALNFQHAGDVLTTSLDPARPAVGDVRIRWYTLSGTALTEAARVGGIVLQDGRWIAAKPAPDAPGVAPATAVDADHGVPGLSALRQLWSRYAWLITALGVIVLVLSGWRLARGGARGSGGSGGKRRR